MRIALFLAGASVMMLQLVGTRVIGPHFGLGLFVWTSLIAVTLLSLGLGYWYGGILADRYPNRICFAAVLLAAALAVALIAPIRRPVLEMGWSFGLRTGSLVSSSLLFAPSLTLLGMVSPLAIRLEAVNEEEVGRTAGTLYAISTAGSVFGVLLAGFLLIPSLRIPTVLALIACALVVASLLAVGPVFRKAVAFSALLIGLGSVLLAWPTPKPAALLAQRNYQGADLRVVEYEGDRLLFVNQAVQSGIDAQGRALEKYIYILGARVLMARPEAKDAAVVGVGAGGIVPLLEGHGIKAECVDLVSEVIDLARSYFGFKQPSSQVHLMDGRVYLKQNPGRFDLVVMDVFQGDSVPYQLFSKEGFQTAKAALRPGGLVALNSWGIDLAKGGPNELGSAIRATLSQVFTHVLAVPIEGDLLFFASDAPITPKQSSVELVTFDGNRTFTWAQVPAAQWPEAPILSDDSNPLEQLGLSMVEGLRTESRAKLPKHILAALAWD